MKLLNQIGNTGLIIDESKDEVELVVNSVKTTLSIAEVHFIIEKLHSWLHYRTFGLPESINAVKHYSSQEK